MRGYASRMLAKLTFMKPLVVGGAVAAAIAAAPLAGADSFATGLSMTGPTPTHVVFKDDPGGGGCDEFGRGDQWHDAPQGLTTTPIIRNHIHANPS